MGIEAWADNPTVMGSFLKFPDDGVLEFVFISDGVVEQVKGTDNFVVTFDVEAKGSQWKFSTGSKRLLSALKDVAKEHNNSLAGLHVRIERSGDKYATTYKVKVL